MFLYWICRDCGIKLGAASIARFMALSLEPQLGAPDDDGSMRHEALCGRCLNERLEDDSWDDLIAEFCG